MESTVASFWQSFNWVDVGLGIGLLTTLVIGLGLGLYRQLAIVCSLILGLVVASQATAPLASSSIFGPMQSHLGNSGAEALAFTGVLLLTLLLGLGTLLIFRKTFGKTLSLVDAVLGGVLGLVVACMLFGLFAMGVFHWEETALHEPINSSYLGSRLAKGTRLASFMFPKDYRLRVENSLRELPALVESRLKSVEEPDPNK